MCLSRYNVIPITQWRHLCFLQGTWMPSMNLVMHKPGGSGGAGEPYHGGPHAFSPTDKQRENQREHHQHAEREHHHHHPHHHQHPQSEREHHHSERHKAGDTKVHHLIKY